MTSCSVSRKLLAMLCGVTVAMFVVYVGMPDVYVTHSPPSGDHVSYSQLVLDACQTVIGIRGAVVEKSTDTTLVNNSKQYLQESYTALLSAQSSALDDYLIPLSKTESSFMNTSDISLSNSTDTSFNSTTWLSRRDPSTGNVTKVLIYARLRSGSTFSSEFFSRHQRVFYLYEPLRRNSNAGRDMYVDSAVAKDTLEKLFSCDFNPIYKNKTGGSWLRTRAFCNLPDQMPGCEKQFQRLSQRKVTENCDNSEVRAIKSIRVGAVRDVWPLMEQGLQLVQVVRDPRGTLASRRRSDRSLANITKISVEAEDFCRRGVEDVKFIREKLSHTSNIVLWKSIVQQNYLVLRYEDLASNASFYMDRIYTFMGVKPDDALRKWADNTTQKVLTAVSKSKNKNPAEYYYGTERANPKYASMAWRKTISMTTVSTIDKVCSEYYDIFGYTAIPSTRKLRDIGTSLLQPFDITAVLDLKS